MDPGQENWSVWVPRAHQTSQAGRKTGAMGGVSHGCVWKYTINIYIYAFIPPGHFFLGKLMISQLDDSNAFDLRGLPIFWHTRIPMDSTLTGRDSCGLHITGKYGILLGSFSKVATIVLADLLWFIFLLVNVSQKIWEIGVSSTRLGVSELDCQNCGRNPIEIETECKILLMWATQKWT